MSLRYCLLGLINYGEMTGYELDKVFKESLYPVCTATTSQIYRELTYMEKQKWLVSREEFQKGKPNRKVYAITEEGKGELKSWLIEDHISEEMRIKHPFYMQMFFAGENSIEENLKILEHMKEVVTEEWQKAKFREAQMENYIRKVDDQTKSLYWKLLNEFSMEYYKQLLDWADRCIERLKNE